MTTLDSVPYRKRREGNAFRVVVSKTVNSLSGSLKATLEATGEGEHYIITDAIVISSHAARAQLVSSNGVTEGTEVPILNSRLDLGEFTGNITALQDATVDVEFEENFVPVGGGKGAIRLGGVQAGGVVVLPSGKSVSVNVENLTDESSVTMSVMFLGYRVRSKLGDE